MVSSFSIRWNLLGSMTILIVLLSGAILGTTALAQRDTVRGMSRSLLSQTIDQTVERLHRFFDPVAPNLLLLRAWSEAGLLDTDDAAAMNRLLAPLMTPYPQMSAILVSDARGREHMLLHDGDRWRNRQTRRDIWGARTRWLEWATGDRTPTLAWRELDYDPRARPWYQRAVEHRDAMRGSATDLVTWTAPYTFFTMAEPGITAATAFDVGGVTRVVGIDVLLSEISIYTMRLRPSPRGVVVVLADDGRVVGLPRSPRFDDARARRAALLAPPAALEMPVVGDILHVLAARPDARGPARFASAGEAWWGERQRFELAPGRALSVVVVVPEVDLQGGLGTIRWWIVGLTAVALAGAMLWAVALATRFCRPIEALVRENDRISRGDLEPGPGVLSSISEIRWLAQAHERMRQALRTLFKMERDLQLARQIQQATLPAELPTLAGFEVEGWCEPAEATGGDTYDVIGIDEGHGAIISSGSATRAVMVLADAAGHGIGPALSVTQVRAMLRMAVGGGHDLASIVRRMNAQLAVDLRDGHFITAWFGLLDVRDQTLTTVSCGQGPILHYVAARDECLRRPADTVPLGVFEKLEALDVASVVLAVGDVVVVASDGIFEARNGAGEWFGTERVIALIRERHGATAAEFLGALRDAVSRFTEGTTADDDRTALVIKRCQEGKGEPSQGSPSTR